jgi:hypothetical protein
MGGGSANPREESKQDEHGKKNEGERGRNGEWKAAGEGEGHKTFNIVYVTVIRGRSHFPLTTG